MYGFSLVSGLGWGLTRIGTIGVIRRFSISKHRVHRQVTDQHVNTVANCRSTHYNAMKTRYNDPEVDIEHH